MRRHSNLFCFVCLFIVGHGIQARNGCEYMSPPHTPPPPNYYHYYAVRGCDNGPPLVHVVANESPDSTRLVVHVLVYCEADGLCACAVDNYLEWMSDSYGWFLPTVEKK